MSYNIDSMEFISGELSIDRDDFLRLFEEVAEANEIPEDSLFHRRDVELVRIPFKPKGKSAQAIADLSSCPETIVFNKDSGVKGDDCRNRLRWRCAGSGSLFDTFKDKVLPRMKGEAELVLIWEGGDSVSGLRIKNGVVTEHKVTYTLVD